MNKKQAYVSLAKGSSSFILISIEKAKQTLVVREDGWMFNILKNFYFSEKLSLIIIFSLSAICHHLSTN